jgi:hypothetical protein
MIKRKKALIVYPLFVILQFSGIILASVLEDLATKKMGVARYLVFKRAVFETSFFTPLLMHGYTLIFGIGAIVCLVLLMKKGKSVKISIALLFATIANVAGIIFIQFKLQLYSYYFFLIGIFIVLLFQYGLMIYLFFKQSIKK